MKSNKKYDKFFAMSVTTSSVLIGVSTIGGPFGAMLGMVSAIGIVVTDKYLLNNKLSETRLNNIFPKKPKN